MIILNIMLDFNIKRFLFSTVGIVYVWSLPLLAYIGFAEKNSNSISAFISNPQATGAMAAVSFMPISLMWEYQDIYIKTYKSQWLERYILDRSIISYIYSLDYILSMLYSILSIIHYLL